MKNIFLIILFSVTGFIFAQNAKIIKWKKSYGSSLGDGINTVKQAADGNYFVGGLAKANDGDVNGFHVNFNDDPDAWILKLDANNGDTLWTRCLGGYYQEVLYDICPTADSGLVAVMSTYSTDGDLDSASAHDFYDAFIVKLNKNGAIVWKKQYGGSGGDFPMSIVASDDGGYVIGGQTSSYDYDIVDNHDSTTYDYWLLKLDANGNKKWSKCYGGKSNDYLTSIVKAGNFYYMVGSTEDSLSGDVAGINKGGDDFWVVKVDTAGTLVWQKLFGGKYTDIPYNVIGTLDGGCLIAGRTDSDEGDIQSGLHGYYNDAWIVRLDASGTLKWEKTYGGIGDDHAYAIALNSDGGFVFAGNSYSDLSGDVPSNFGSGDGFLVRADSVGNKIWSYSLGGSNDDVLQTIVKTSDGGFLVGGVSASSNHDLTNNNGGDDAWLMKIWNQPVVNAEICLVTVDSSSSHNIVIWEDSKYPVHVKSTNVYRVLGTGLDSLIANIPVTSISEYVDIDPKVDPGITSFVYKIAAVDELGNEFPKSVAHRTINLTASKGQGASSTSLVWTDYSGITSPGGYDFYYGSKTTQPTLLTSKAFGAGTTYNDQSPNSQALVGDQLYYFMVLHTLKTCNTSKSYNDSKSNTALLSVVGVSENQWYQNLSLAPNPTNNVTQIHIELQNADKVTIKLIDIAGKTILSQTTACVKGTNAIVLNTEQIPAGIYSLQLMNELGQQSTRSLIKY